jgi:gluconate kinase
MKTVYIFFGEMGSGKSYCGERFAKGQGYKFFEGDSVLTPRMLARVSKFRSVSEEILQEYMDVLADAIADQMEDCENLVVAQAFYRDEDRKSMITFLECLGYCVKMWWVRVRTWRNVQNLFTRQDGWKWFLYWLMNKPFFQRPTHPYQECLNIYR